MSIFLYVMLFMFFTFPNRVLICSETMVNYRGYGGDSEKAKFVFH